MRLYSTQCVCRAIYIRENEFLDVLRIRMVGGFSSGVGGVRVLYVCVY